MTVEELRAALAPLPDHYTVKAFREGYEIKDFEAHFIAVDCQPQTKSVDLVIEFPPPAP
jgi:hypothetical protein